MLPCAMTILRKPTPKPDTAAMVLPSSSRMASVTSCWAGLAIALRMASLALETSLSSQSKHFPPPSLSCSLATSTMRLMMVVACALLTMGFSTWGVADGVGVSPWRRLLDAAREEEAAEPPPSTISTPSPRREKLMEGMACTGLSARPARCAWHPACTSLCDMPGAAGPAADGRGADPKEAAVWNADRASLSLDSSETLTTMPCAMAFTPVSPPSASHTPAPSSPRAMRNPFAPRTSTLPLPVVSGVLNILSGLEEGVGDAAALPAALMARSTVRHICGGILSTAVAMLWSVYASADPGGASGFFWDSMLRASWDSAKARVLSILANMLPPSPPTTLSVRVTCWCAL
mmetsp:Transcript_37685/g.96308  ORF Transcript_37685/g.96308 Transcript_37685/m.96308 type:complete len:347 (+) Transcript_37685:177-1217(+)